MNAFSLEASRIGGFSDVRLLDEFGQPLTHESLVEIDFGAISYTEVLQNVKTILTTPLFTVPLDRLFGMNYTVIDEPINHAQNFIIPEILAKIQRFERRARVLEVTFEGDGLVGHLIPTIRIQVQNETYRAREPYTMSHAFST